MHYQVETVKSALNLSLKVIKMYEWLLDLFVLDFFVDNHWKKLPPRWRESFRDIDPQDLGNILSGKPTKHLLPLSFLALIKTVQTLSIPREKTAEPVNNKIYDTNSCTGHPRLKNIFLKHVKLKKRHEISLMANLVADTAFKSDCNAVIDFGSGLGHLVRMLAYKNDLYAAGIECQNQLTKEARKLDLELEYTARKYLSTEAMSKLHRPFHFNVTLSSHKQLHELSLPNTMRTYGLIGLHPCGDLGSLLLDHFVNCDTVKFICIVGCCYMKLTNQGYPMSSYVKTLDNTLSYVSREIACHAIEVYVDRLRRGLYEDLKIHAYRAALERILVSHDPKLKHAPVRSIKHSNTMTFQRVYQLEPRHYTHFTSYVVRVPRPLLATIAQTDAWPKGVVFRRFRGTMPPRPNEISIPHAQRRYCTLALEKLNVPLPTSPETWSQGAADLSRWRQVVTVYTLRLALAPLVETVVLLDRVLYVVEHGLSCTIRPVFDPKLSPRSHIIIGRRL